MNNLSNAHFGSMERKCDVDAWSSTPCTALKAPTCEWGQEVWDCMTVREKNCHHQCGCDCAKKPRPATHAEHPLSGGESCLFQNARINVRHAAHASIFGATVENSREYRACGGADVSPVVHDTLLDRQVVINERVSAEECAAVDLQGQ